MNKVYLIIIIYLLGVISCGGERSNDPVAVSDDNLKVALQEIIDFSLIPAVDSFAQQTLKLSESANTFCATPTENQLTALQQNWKNAYDSWFRLANYVFGPLDDDIIFPTYTFIDSLRLRGTDYLNTVRVENAADINGTHTLDNRYFSNKTFQRVGLLALESILFETTSSDRSTAKPDIVNEFQSSSRKCEVLQGLMQAHPIGHNFLTAH